MDFKDIMELTKWLEQSAFTAYSLSVNGVNLSVSKQQGLMQPQAQPQPMPSMAALPVLTTPTTPAAVPVASAQPQATPALAPLAAAPAPAPVNAEAAGHIIKSPIVGTFYKSSSPEGKAFVEVGQKVKKGDVVCVVEAMKVMNEITSDVDGTVLEILATNGEMVEARMPLFRLEV